MKDRLRSRIACQGFCQIADSVEDELARVNLYYYGFHTDELGWKLHELQASGPKSDAYEAMKRRDNALYKHNQALLAEVKTLTQRVEDLQLHVSSTDNTSKKDVRFSVDSASPAQLLQAALPSMSASDLHMLALDVWREIGKFLPSASAALSTGPQVEIQQPSPEVHQSPQGMSAEPPVSNPRDSLPPSPEKTLSPARGKGPGAKAKVPGYLQGTAAADAKRAATLGGPVTGGTTARPETRTSTRPETRTTTRPETGARARPVTPKTSGKPAPGTREDVHTGDRRRYGHTTAGGSPPSPSTVAAATPKKGKTEPVAKGQGSTRGGTIGSMRGRGRGRGRGRS